MINKFKNFEIRSYQDTLRAPEEIQISGIQNLSELHRKQLIQYHKIWYPNNDMIIVEYAPFKKKEDKSFEFFSFFAELLLSFTKDTDDPHKKLRLLLPGFKNFYFKDTQALFHIAGYSFSECNAMYKKRQFYIKESKEAIIKNTNIFWFVEYLKQSAKSYDLPKKIINKATLFALLQHKIMPCYNDVENYENSYKKELPLQKKILKKLPATLLSIIEEEPIDIISLYPLKAKKIKAMVDHYDGNQKVEFKDKLLSARTKVEQDLSENQYDLEITQNTEKNIKAINKYLG